MFTALRTISCLSCIAIVLTLGCSPKSAPSVSSTTTTGVAIPPSLARAVTEEEVVNEMPAWAGRDENEPFDVRSFLASRIGPPNEAAQGVYLSLVTRSNQLWEEIDPAFEKQVSELAEINKLAADRSPSAELDRLLLEAAPALEQIDAALALGPAEFNASLHPDSLLPQGVLGRLVGQLSLLQIKQGCAAGNFPQVERAVERGLRFARDLQLRSALVCQLVSIAVENRILTGIQRIVLADPDLTIAQIDRLLELIDAHQKQSHNRVEEGLRMEYVMARNGLHAVQTGRLTIQEMVEYTLAEPPPDELGGITTMRPPLCNFPAEIRTCNEIHKAALEAAGQPTFQADRMAAYDQLLLEYRAQIDVLKNLVAGTPRAERPQLFDQAPACLFYFFTPVLNAFLEADCRCSAQLSTTQMLLALRRYQLVRGRLPADLTTAAEETIVKRVPLDPYDGQPLRFVIVDGKPIVYSVGQDRADQGGQVDAQFGQQPAGDYLFALPAVIKP